MVDRTSSTLAESMRKDNPTFTLAPDHAIVGPGLWVVGNGQATKIAESLDDYERLRSLGVEDEEQRPPER